MRSTRVLLLLLFVLIIPEAHAQVGKIAGRVTDAVSGEPLIGVNVLIESTQQGTVTDLDGNYVILNVRPGDYTLVFSYIGFATQRINEVRVITGQTTRYDLEMSEQVIEGEEVIVTAERPLIQKDLTASKKTVLAEEIEALPVESFFGVLVTQAGVTTGPGGEIHVRGGRSNEVAYLVDGMSVGNPFSTNGLATSVATDAIQEMTVISGAFNAEYGKAMSGIVNLVTKEGGDRYEGSFSFYGGDTWTRHEDLYLSPGFMSSEAGRLGVYTMEGTLSGPLPFARKVRVFLSGRLDESEGYIWGRREHLPSDSANFNGDEGLLETIREFIPDYNGPAWYYELHGKPWYEYGEGEEIPADPVNMNPSEGGNFIAKLSTRPITGSKLEYSFLADRSRSRGFNFAYRFNPDGVASFRSHSFNHSLHWTQTLDDRTFYTVRTSIATNRDRSYLHEIGDIPVVDEDTPLVSSLAEAPFPFYVSSGAVVGFPGNNFLFGGDQKGYVNESARSFRLKADATRQIGIIHEAKIGVDLQLHRLSRQNLVVLFNGDQYRVPTIPAVNAPAHDRYEDQKVTEFSAFAQDKLEFDDFIINVGLRYEHFNPHGKYVPNLLNPFVEDFTTDLGEATTKNILLPRLGVSFPITDTGIIHFSYGHFAQMPPLRSMYVNPEFEFPVGGTLYGNTNLRPERTVQYEIGLQQQLTSQLAFDITGFFKDIRDYLATQTIRFSTIAGQDQYSIQLNRDYANVKGVTFALTKRRARNGLVSATVDYTFQVAEGNRTDSDAFFFNTLSGRENELEIIPLNFDVRHTFSSTLTLSRPGNWSAGFIGQATTGYPYTPLLIDQKIDQLPNQERKPNNYKLDFTASKDVRVSDRARLRVFAKVFNVLDHLNERFVFNDTGRATYSLAEQRGQFAAWETALELGLPGIHSPDEYQSRPQYYSRPREVRVGATLNF
ncbi:MAG: carboxypeptidase-like regulatory domain-containing protein [Rhodothermales bacterium]|nr:carboxypeptidase-like regulatory domain-containing protein [Rhodothermales bacterium]MBO6779921.1 carboxypeptidase-like regulatory domain-containing protein [Rhodothermales bacterium]